MQRTYDPKLVTKAVHTIAMLAVDGVEKASSGHPGTPMALAGIAFEIWTRHLRYDPKNPSWPDRDRFVLSCGHASMLLYGMLHLSGYDVSLEDLRQFRQWGSKTPGHPEVHHTPGVEVTTGPLGQGISNAVGMAASIKMLAARFNGAAPVSTARVFGICSDGDVMEGVSGEAASLAGHLGLGNLNFFYDDNKITIDGSTSLAFTEDVGRRYESYGWHVQHIDGHDPEQIRAALDAAVAETARPSLIVARTHIGLGSPNRVDTSKAHGEPLGAAEVKATKEALGWPLEPTFLVPSDVQALFDERAKDGARERASWLETAASVERHPQLGALYKRLMAKDVPADLLEKLCAAAPQKSAATRVQSGLIEQKVAELVPSFMGGSADLNPSTKTYINDSTALQKGDFSGRNVHFGIREHAMGAFVNGVAVSDGFIPFGATFFVFSDYMRPTIRLAALSNLQSIFVFTHESVYLGEDGPTHQPVEHLWALRVIPNTDVVRPCDALECAAAWAHALQRRSGPTILALTRQTLHNLERPAGFKNELMLKGAYVIAEASGGAPTMVIMATGSEVEPSLAAKKLLEAEGERVRLVSAPCWDAFQRQDKAYRQSVLPPGVPRVIVELGVSEPWQGAAGDDGLVIGHDGFGTSAPAEVIQEKFGFTPDAIAKKIRTWKKGA